MAGRPLNYPKARRAKREGDEITRGYVRGGLPEKPPSPLARLSYSHVPKKKRKKSYKTKRVAKVEERIAQEIFDDLLPSLKKIDEDEDMKERDYYVKKESRWSANQSHSR